MKKAKVIYKHISEDSICEGIILESMEDIKHLQKMLDKAETGVINKCVKSGESPSRYDHVIYGMRPIEKAIASLANVYSISKENNMLYNLPHASIAFLNTAMSIVLRGEKVFMNKNGGMTPMDTLEIIEEEEIDEIYDGYIKYYIGKNSKVINLENDFQLERTARDYMRGSFKNSYSYILELSTIGEIMLKNIFKKFKEQGGEVVYVYTTGQNVQQMYDYSKTALEVGLNNFIFDFNVGTNEEINKFVETLKSKAEVEII